MHELRSLLENLPDARRKTEARRVSFDFDALEALAEKRRNAIQDFESLRAEQKTASGAMRGLKPGSPEFDETRAKLKAMSDRIKELEGVRKDAEAELDAVLLTLPNLIADEVPIGESEADNLVVATVGEPPLRGFSTVFPTAEVETKPSFEFKDHVDLGEALGLLDFEAAARVAGARFAFLRGPAARLERALTNFMLDLHTSEHGYEELNPPYLVNADAMTGTGQLPKFEADLFKTTSEPALYLIPTAEVPVTNYYRDQLRPEYDGPQKFCAFTPCFRSEAGSHGRDTRGLIRQHQFNKVELVQFVHPDESEAAHQELTGHARTVLDRLELPYRVVELCSADVGFSARRCYDLEVWLPGQDRYREISSCSNFGEFQARRAGIRFRDGDGKPRFYHTLNGSGLAIGRTLVAILENFQQEDGSVTIPDALRPYTRFDRIAKG